MFWKHRGGFAIANICFYYICICIPIKTRNQSSKFVFDRNLKPKYNLYGTYVGAKYVIACGRHNHRRNAGS